MNDSSNKVTETVNYEPLKESAKQGLYVLLACVGVVMAVCIVFVCCFSFKRQIKHPVSESDCSAEVNAPVDFFEALENTVFDSETVNLNSEDVSAQISYGKSIFDSSLMAVLDGYQISLDKGILYIRDISENKCSKIDCKKVIASAEKTTDYFSSLISGFTKEGRILSSIPADEIAQTINGLVKDGTINEQALANVTNVVIDTIKPYCEKFGFKDLSGFTDVISNLDSFDKINAITDGFINSLSEDTFVLNSAERVENGISYNVTLNMKSLLNDITNFIESNSAFASISDTGIPESSTKILKKSLKDFGIKTRKVDFGFTINDGKLIAINLPDKIIYLSGVDTDKLEADVDNALKYIGENCSETEIDSMADMVVYLIRDVF